MKKIYEQPRVTGRSFSMPQPVMAAGSIENMQYGRNNVFGDDDDDSKKRDEYGYESEGIQNSLW